MFVTRLYTYIPTPSILSVKPVINTLIILINTTAHYYTLFTYPLYAKTTAIDFTLIKQCVFSHLQ